MSPTNAQAHVKARLISLLESIKSSDAAAITSHLASLEEIVEREAGSLPQELAHMLKRRSYAKAMAFFDDGVPAK
jgi:hypothetical protein